MTWQKKNVLRTPACSRTEDAGSEIRWCSTGSAGEGVQSNHSDIMILDVGHWKSDIRNLTGPSGEHISQLPLLSGTILKVPKDNLDYLPSWTNSAEIARRRLGKSYLYIFLILVMSIFSSSPHFHVRQGSLSLSSGCPSSCFTSSQLPSSPSRASGLTNGWQQWWQPGASYFCYSYPVILFPLDFHIS